MPGLGGLQALKVVTQCQTRPVLFCHVRATDKNARYLSLCVLDRLVDEVHIFGYQGTIEGAFQWRAGRRQGSRLIGRHKGFTRLVHVVELFDEALGL